MWASPISMLQGVIGRGTTPAKAGLSGGKVEMLEGGQQPQSCVWKLGFSSHEDDKNRRRAFLVIHRGSNSGGG